MGKDKLVCRELDFLQVQDKTEPTRIYEIVGEKNEEKDLEWLYLYEKALHLYRKKSGRKQQKYFLN